MSKTELNPHLSVVIPVYKAEDCLDELYLRLVKSLESVSSDFEILMIEDCGGDRSWELIQALAANDSRVRGIQFSRNFGQHYGITAGMDHCRGDWVVVMDCDLQDQPEEIPKLYAKAQEGYDVVLAHRGLRSDPLLKRFGSKLFYRVFSWLTDIPYDGDSGNFRILSRKVVMNFRRMGEQLRFFGGMVRWMGFPTASVEIQHANRFAGKSSYTFRKLWRMASENIIAFSDKPLRLAIRFGFSMAAISFFYGAYIFLHAFLYGSPITGWSSLIVSLYFLSGIIISILGILGIYLGKTFDETKMRPLYIIRDQVGIEQDR
jgi:glycosyltransferase involved in cell wall biosynthesis